MESALAPSLLQRRQEDWPAVLRNGMTLLMVTFNLNQVSSIRDQHGTDHSALQRPFAKYYKLVIHLICYQLFPN